MRMRMREARPQAMPMHLGAGEGQGEKHRASLLFDRLQSAKGCQGYYRWMQGQQQQWLCSLTAECLVQLLTHALC